MTGWPSTAAVVDVRLDYDAEALGVRLRHLFERNSVMRDNSDNTQFGFHEGFKLGLHHRT